MATPSEVDGSRRWTPHAARREIRAGATQDWAWQRGRAGRRMTHHDYSGCTVDAALRVDDAMKVVAVVRGENIQEWKNERCLLG
jgi:hypothetical protein